MKKSRKKKWGCALTVLAVVIVAGIFGLHWAWKYYGLPEWPDRREYKTIEERADKALAFARCGVSGAETVSGAKNACDAERAAGKHPAL